MGPTNRQFRVFVSSTFSDFKHEREALQDRVFRNLRAYCELQGAQFQAIDLRWGISEAAANDHQTVRICLKEIRRSQRLSPRPNLIVLLGDRYGWRPVPDKIPADELEQLRPYINAEDASLIDAWYGRDDNAIPPVYYLRPRTADTDDNAWQETHERLAVILHRASIHAALPESEQLKYTASATHLEVHEGLFEVPDAEHRVFAYRRQIHGLPQPGEAAALAGDFVDLRDGRRDEAAAARQRALRDSVRARLPDHTPSYNTQWQGSDIGCEHIDQFCIDVEADLKAVIDRELAQIEEIDPLEWEVEQHRSFAAERARNFVGRQSELAQIADYLASDNATPLVIHGIGGAGKSALLAKANQQLNNPDAVVIQRYIGTTPESSQIRSLLTSLCIELGRHYGTDDTVAYEKLDELYSLFLTRLELASSNKPLILALDALDQLDSADLSQQLLWLPDSLPPAVRLMVSTREKGPDDQLLLAYQAAQRRYEPGLVSLGTLSRENADGALDLLLTSERTVTALQRTAILNAFEVCGLPLYLKLVAERARHWRSDTAIPLLPTDVPSMVRALISDLQDPANHGPLLVERALAYLQCGRYGGLAENELARALALDTDVIAEFRARSLQPWHRPELPPILWARLQADLEAYLTEQNIDGALLLRFFHREFAEVVSADMLTADDSQERHSTLSEAFTWHSDPAAFRSAQEIASLRQMMELPYQLRQAEVFDQSKKLLTDFNFAYNKCAANRSDDLVNDYLEADDQQTSSDPDWHIWVQFMRSRAHILRRGNTHWPAHKILQQLAIEHAEDSPLTNVVDKWLKTDNCDWNWFRSTYRPKNIEIEKCLAVVDSPIAPFEGVKELQDGRLIVWYDEFPECQMLSHDGRVLKILQGHRGNIIDVHEFPDNRLLSWAYDGSIRIWSKTGILLKSIKGRHGEMGVQVLSEQRFISWHYGDPSIRLWSDQGELIACLQEHDGAIINVIILTDAKFISWTENGTLRLWSASGELLKIIRNVSNIFDGIHTCPKGGFLAWPEGGKTIQLFTSRGNPQGSLVGHSSAIEGVKLMPNGNIVSYSYGEIRWWSGQGQLLAAKDKFYDRIHITVLSGNRFLIWSNTSDTLELWSSEGVPLQNLENPIGESGFGGAIALPDNQFLTWSEDNTLSIWGENGKYLGALQGHNGQVLGAKALSGGRVLSWSHLGEVRLWSITSFDQVHVSLRKFEISNAIPFSDGRIVSWSRYEHVIRFWSSTGRPEGSVDVTHSRIEGIALTLDEKILVWCKDSVIKIFSKNGSAVATLQGHMKSINGVKEIRHGRLLSWSDDGTLRLWSETGRPVAVLEGHKKSVVYAEQLNDGRLASVSWDLTIHLWSESGKLIHILRGHTSGITFFMELSDGRLLSWSRHGGEAILWTKGGNSIATLKHKEIHIIVCLSDDKFMSYGKDEHRDTLKLWSKQGALIKEVITHYRFNGKTHFLQLKNGGFLTASQDDKCIEFWSNAGRLLANIKSEQVDHVKALSDGRILSWSIMGNVIDLWSTNGEKIAYLRLHSGRVREVTEILEGQIYSCFYDGSMEVFRLPDQHENPRRMAPVCVDSIAVANSESGYKYVLNKKDKIRKGSIWAITDYCPLLLNLYHGVLSQKNL